MLENIISSFLGCHVSIFYSPGILKTKGVKFPKLGYICHLVLVSEVLDHNPLPEKAFVHPSSVNRFSENVF